MHALAPDTPAHIEAEIVGVLRAMTYAQKAAMLTQMSVASDQLALAGIRLQYRAAPETWDYHLALRRLPHERQAAASPLLKELCAMQAPVNPVAVAVQVSAILGRLGIRHYMGGSFASSIFGEYRTTRDLDVVLYRPERVWRQLVGELRPLFTFTEADVTEALSRVQVSDGRFVSFAMYHQTTGYQVDMFIARDMPYERALFARIFQADLVEGMVWVPTAEDAILTKLRWYALTPSEMQWRDVQAMLRVQAPSLDYAYLRTWGATLGISPLVEQAIAGEKPTAPSENPDQLRLF